VVIVSVAICFSSAAESNTQILVLFHHWCNILFVKNSGSM
jgi:hypothetical protein